MGGEDKKFSHFIDKVDSYLLGGVCGICAVN
jgi:hypothetical protein